MKTVLGYHDKNKGKYGILEKSLPLLTDERYVPFLITTEQFISTKTSNIRNWIKTEPLENSLRTIKNRIGLVLLIPGVITSVIYLLEYTISGSATSRILPKWLANATFWIAVWGAIILWHETYRKYKIKESLKNSRQFMKPEIDSIKNGDLGISQLKHVNAIEALDKEVGKNILKCINKNEIDTYKLLNILIKDNRSKKILQRMSVPKFKKEFKKYNINKKTLPKYDLSALRSILIYAANEAVYSRSNHIHSEHILIMLFHVFPALQDYLRKKRLNIDIMRKAASWIQIQKDQAEAVKILDPSVPYTPTGGVASRIVYGYTYILGHYSKDLTQQMARIGQRYGIGHETDMENAMSILSKNTKNNVLIIGESGTGKTSMVKGIAEKINRNKVPNQLLNKRIIQLDLNGLIAASSKHGNLETLVQESMQELQKAGDAILFIDEIQEIVPAKGSESQHSLAGILLPYIVDSKFPIIGTISYAEYKKYFYTRESLRTAFQTVEIDEVSPDAAFEIILTRLDELEETYDIRITFPAIMTAIELAQRYVFDRKLPDSAVNIIETACTRAQESQERYLNRKTVEKVVSQQTEIPVEDVTEEEATKLLELEKSIKTKVIGQDHAVHQVVEALKRARAGVRDMKKPIGTFLFLGPTGVGKTYLAKTLSTEYFGDEKDIIRLDMSEFKETDSIDRLLGSNQSDENSQTSITFLDQVKQNPFTVVLLDEIEKAHPQILDLFLQLLDEGRLTSNTGETVNFNNTIIIATSNIGSNLLLDAVSESRTMFEEAKERVLLELRQKVRVEFLNRFDKIIVFSPHSTKNLTKISDLLLKELKVRLLEKQINIKWDEDIPRIIAQKSRESGLGARPIRRYIQEKVEGKIATKLLEREIKPGDVYHIEKEMFEGDT